MVACILQIKTIGNVPYKILSQLLSDIKLDPVLDKTGLCSMSVNRSRIQISGSKVHLYCAREASEKEKQHQLEL